MGGLRYKANQLMLNLSIQKLVKLKSPDSHQGFLPVVVVCNN